MGLKCAIARCGPYEVNMSPMLRPAVRAAALTACLAALAACATRPKPLGPAPTATTPPAAAARPYGAAVPPPGAVSETEQGGVPAPGSERDFVVNVGDRVYFDFDQFEVRADGRALLDAQAAWLNRYPQVRVRIEGNCDEKGTREYNFALGARRANSVREYLAGRGVSLARIETVSYGKEHPIDLSGTDEGAAKNRNAHTAITGGQR